MRSEAFKVLKRKLPPVLLSLIAAGALFVGSFAYRVPDAPKNGGVYDDAGVMEYEDIEHILTLNDRLDEYCGGQIAVAVFTGIGGADIASYSMDVFNEWGVGSKSKNNGVLLLMSIADADYWVVQGKGIEDDITSGDLGLMLDDELEPYFAREEYSEGAVRFADALYKKYASVYGFSPSIPQTEQVQPLYGNNGQSSGITASGVIRTIIGLIVLYFIIKAIASILRSCCDDGGCGCGSCCLPALCCCGDGGSRGYGGGWRGPPPGGFGGSAPRGGGFSSGVGRTSGGSSFGGSRHSGGFGGGSSRGGGAGRGRR